MNEQSLKDSLLDIEVDPQIVHLLKDTTRWSKFIAIFYTVILSIMVIGVILGGATLIAGMEDYFEGVQSGIASIVGSMIFVFLAAFVVIGGILLFFLYRFSLHTRAGINEQQQGKFNSGLKALKNYFMVYGIVMLIYIVLYAIAIATGLFTTNTFS